MAERRMFAKALILNKYHNNRIFYTKDTFNEWSALILNKYHNNLKDGSKRFVEFMR